MNCPLCGYACRYIKDVEIAGRTHELHKCRNPRCERTWSPVKIRRSRSGTERKRRPRDERDKVQGAGH
ncbi:hypothetical protein LCGC14_1423770 [marine sediment metagenome]|uniref:Zinc finger Ogr/Delta-type domain-containing protein n=1 Tax=marine sediment metagenome TaxID=412755 RepID=A0A0F9JQE8_9ZZZZ